MRQTKYILPSFAFYDRTGIQNYLEKQAEKGWLLESAGNFRWKFRRIEPKKLRFAVSYFSHADLYDPAPSEEEETFREFCAHSGWILAGANAQMQIFYSERENPTPIETDPLLEVENIHRSMKKNALPAYWILVLSCMLQLCTMCLNLSNGLIYCLSNGMNLFLSVACPALCVIAASRLIGYYRWRRRAKTAAQQEGIFLETRSMVWTENLLSALILLGLLAAILTLKDRYQALVMGLSVAASFAVMALVELLRRKLKKDGYDAASNKKLTLTASVVLTFVLILAVVPPVSRSIMDHLPEETDAGLQLNIWDLLEEEEQEYGTLDLTDQESVLLGYQRIFQYTEGNTISPTLEYNLVEVKASFLYAWCLEEMMIVPARMENGEYITIDPAPWGAEQAWQLHDGEKMRQWYVLCYGDAILELIPSWELTEAQKVKVGEIVN